MLISMVCVLFNKRGGRKWKRGRGTDYGAHGLYCVCVYMYVYMYVHVCTVHVHVTPLAGSLTQQTTRPLALGSGVSSSAISSFTTLSGEDEGIVIGVGLTM